MPFFIGVKIHFWYMLVWAADVLSKSNMYFIWRTSWVLQYHGNNHEVSPLFCVEPTVMFWPTFLKKGNTVMWLEVVVMEVMQHITVNQRWHTQNPGNESARSGPFSVLWPLWNPNKRIIRNSYQVSFLRSNFGRLWLHSQIKFQLVSRVDCQWIKYCYVYGPTCRSAESQIYSRCMNLNVSIYTSFHIWVIRITLELHFKHFLLFILHESRHYMNSGFFFFFTVFTVTFYVFVLCFLDENESWCVVMSCRCP